MSLLMVYFLMAVPDFSFQISGKPKKKKANRQINFKNLPHINIGHPWCLKLKLMTGSHMHSNLVSLFFFKGHDRAEKYDLCWQKRE